MSQSLRVSLGLPGLAGTINDALAALAGEEIAFVLVVQADRIAQYVSNAKREDGAALLESLLARWKANRADIPAHYNPDLRKAPSGEPKPVAQVLSEIDDHLQSLQHYGHSRELREAMDTVAQMQDVLRFLVHWHDQLTPADVQRAKAVIAKATGSAS